MLVKWEYIMFCTVVLVELRALHLALLHYGRSHGKPPNSSQEHVQQCECQFIHFQWKQVKYPFLLTIPNKSSIYILDAILIKLS